MIGRRLHAYFAFVCIAAPAALSAAAFAIERGFYRAVAFVLEILAAPAMIVPPFGRLALDGPAPSYDAPSVHALRHEAGVARRSAARNT